MQLERPLVELPYIFHLQHLQAVILQHPQLEVYLPVVVGEDRHCVFQLVGVGVGRVVHQRYARQVSAQDAQVLHVQALSGEKAVFAEESVVDVLVVGVQVVHHYIGVAGVTGREHHHLKVLAEIAQDLPSVRTHVYTRLNDLSRGKLDGEADCTGWMGGVVAVDEGLVQVEDDSLAVCMQAGVPSYPFRRGRVSRIFRISSSEQRLLRSSILRTLSEVTRCSRARDFSSWQARISSDTQQTLCLGEQGLLLKVRSSACSGTCVTSPFRLIRFSPSTPRLSPSTPRLSPSRMRCFSSFFRCRFRFISVILCSIESSFSCNFLYSLLSMNCFFLALTLPPSGLPLPSVLIRVGSRSGRTSRSRSCGWSLWVERTLRSLMSWGGLVRYFWEQELGRVRLEELTCGGGGASGEFLRLPSSQRSCSLALRARCQYSTSLV